MRARSISLAGTAIVVLALAGGWQYTASGQAGDMEAVQSVMEKYVATINSPEFAKGPRESRERMLRAFYRPDSSYSRTDLPVFLGPLSEPMSRGVNAHIDNTLLNFEYIFRQKMTYGLRIDEMQIEVGTGLAAVMALTTSGYESPDAKTNYVTKGRATVILNKMSNGGWLISHEHLELYNNTNPSVLSKQQLTTEIEKLPK